MRRTLPVARLPRPRAPNPEHVHETISLLLWPKGKGHLLATSHRLFHSHRLVPKLVNYFLRVTVYPTSRCYVAALINGFGAIVQQNSLTCNISFVSGPPDLREQRPLLLQNNPTGIVNSHK